MRVCVLTIYGAGDVRSEFEFKRSNSNSAALAISSAGDRIYRRACMLALGGISTHPHSMMRVQKKERKLSLMLMGVMLTPAQIQFPYRLVVVLFGTALALLWAPMPF